MDKQIIEILLEIQKNQNEMKQEFTSFKSDFTSMKSEFTSSKNEVQQQISSLRYEMNNGFTRLSEQIELLSIQTSNAIIEHNSKDIKFLKSENEARKNEIAELRKA